MLEVLQGEFTHRPEIVWAVWGIVSMLLIVAAIIDGIQLRVPNWLTFPMILTGWAASAWFFGWAGLAASLVGTMVGLACLLPLYAIGGMGAGDVKLMAGIGAWVGITQTFWAFILTVIVGAVIAVGMVLFQRQWRHHMTQFFSIFKEILVIRNPEQLSAIAADRKSTMLLLPYGIPIAIGTIAYFSYAAFIM